MLQDTDFETLNRRERPKHDAAADNGSDRVNREAKLLHQSLRQSSQDLRESLADLGRLLRLIDSPQHSAQCVCSSLGDPEHPTQESASQPIQPAVPPVCANGSGYEDEVLVEGLMALRDELDRLRRESHSTQSELNATRDSAVRIMELEQSLVRSRAECETLRAELDKRYREHEAQSSHAANLIQDQDPEIGPSGTVSKEGDTVSASEQLAVKETVSEADPRLQRLIIQLEESRSANERLRSLLKVFGMVRHLD